MKSFVSFAILIGLFASAPTYAGPVISGGGTHTVKEARGTSQVTNIGESSLVYVFGDAARLLFDSLEVEEFVPTASTSVIKRTSRVECTQNGDEYFCVLPMKHR